MEKANYYPLLLFSLCVQLLAMFFVYSFLAAQVEVPAYEPFGNTTPTEAGLNAVTLVLPALVTTLVLIGLLRIFGLKVFTYLLAILPLLTAVIINPIFIFTVANNYLPDYLSAAADPIALVSTGLLMFAIFYSTVKHVRRLSSACTLIISAEVGALFALMLQPPTLFIVPVAFAVYDIYAVFAGPLKMFISQLAKSNFPKAKRRPSISRIKQSLNLGVFAANISGFTIGTGDLVFYSLVVAGAFMIGGILTGAATLVAVNAGSALTFLLLTKYKKVLPGLPIPIFLGVATLVVFTYLL